MILGLAALFLALGLGVSWAGLSVDEVFLAFPTSLFITIFSVTLLIKVAEENGTFEKLTSAGIALCRGRLKAMPFLVFIASAIFSAFGLGNIATTALMAPAAISIGRSAKLDPFLMTLMVIGGANASVMSPFSPTGLLARGLVSRFPDSSVTSAKFAWGLFSSSFLLIGIVHLIGFFILGGWRWLRQTELLDAPVDKPMIYEAWNRKQFYTLGILGLFFTLNLIFGIDKIRMHLPSLLQTLGVELSVTALLCLLIAAILRIGSLEKASRHVPWGLLILICGMGTLVLIVEKTAGFGVITDLATQAGSGWALILIVSIFAAALSVFSSSSGVVMPLFIPMVPALVAGGLGVSPMLLVTAIIVSSHLVDCSPFSSLGALAIASVNNGSRDYRTLFKRLTTWGLTMVIVGAVISTLAYWVI